MIKPEMKRREEHVACMRGMRQNIDVFKWLLEKQSVRMWTGFIWVRTGSIGGLCTHDNLLSGSVTGEEFLGKLNDYQLLKKDLDPWSELVICSNPHRLPSALNVA
jgi:hypothetical protein